MSFWSFIERNVGVYIIIWMTVYMAFGGSFDAPRLIWGALQQENYVTGQTNRYWVSI